MKIAAIRLRKGRVNESINHTLNSLNLTNQHIMIILDNTPSNMGALKKVKDYVTWGELNEENEKKYSGSKIHTLHPPRGGFERKGIKQSFSIGGALGYRAEKINDLLVKMSK